MIIRKQKPADINYIRLGLTSYGRLMTMDNDISADRLAKGIWDYCNHDNPPNKEIFKNIIILGGTYNRNKEGIIHKETGLFQPVKDIVITPFEYRNKAII